MNSAGKTRAYMYCVRVKNSRGEIKLNCVREPNEKGSGK